MEVIGTIKGVRDLLEHSRAKDIIAENPDYASNPEIIDQIGAVNPDLGNQLRGTLPKALELREQRAAAGALWAKRALGAGMKAYQGALNASEEGGPVTEANFAEADKAAQDMYGRFRRVMKDKGFNVDSLLPPVWSLRDQDRLEAEYGAITDAMRTPYNVVKPDGSAETMYFLPGEDAQFAATMKKGGQPVRVEKLGTAAPAATTAGNEVIEFKTNEGRFKQQFQKTPQGLRPIGQPVRVSDRAIEGDSVGAQHENAMQTIGPRLAKGEVLSPEDFTAYNAAYRYATQPQLITETGTDGKQVQRWQQPQAPDARLFPAPEQAQPTEGGWRFTPGASPPPGAGGEQGGKPGTVAGVKGMAFQDAARVSSLGLAAKQLPGIERMLFDEDGNPKFWDQLAGSFNIPKSEGRRLQQKIKLVVESKLRADSGAAVPDQEVARFTDMFAPTAGDSKEAVQDKLQAMREWVADTYTNLGMDPPKEVAAYLRGERSQGGGAGGAPGGLPQGAKVQTGSFKSPSGKTFNIVPE